MTIDIGNFTAIQEKGVWIYKAKETPALVLKKKKKKVPVPFKAIGILEKELQDKFDNLTHDITIDIVNFITNI